MEKMGGAGLGLSATGDTPLLIENESNSSPFD